MPQGLNAKELARLMSRLKPGPWNFYIFRSCELAGGRDFAVLDQRTT
jgi:hypothetical protein